MTNTQLKRYIWRLHPLPQAATLKTTTPKRIPQKSVAIEKISSRNKGLGHKHKSSFQLGDNVYVRPKSSRELGISGRIVDVYDVSNKSKSKRRKLEEVRVSVQPHCFNRINDFCSTTKKDVRPSRLSPVYDIPIDGDCNESAQALILLTPDTTNYRQLAASHLRLSDKVLEIGCSTGECTVLLLRRLLLLHLQQHRCKNQEKVDIGKIVAFDTGSGMVEQAKKRLLSEFDHSMPANDDDCQQTRNKFFSQTVQFHKVDALADPKGAHSHVVDNNNNKVPDVVLIDIGGNRELKGVVRMIDWVQSVFQPNPRLIIVKSEALVEELQKSEESKDGREGKNDEDHSYPVDGNVGSNTKHSVLESGIILNAQEWFASLVNGSNEDPKCNSAPDVTNPKQSAPKYSHPIKAPLVLSPKDNATPICRFHNYHPNGCKRHNNDSNEDKCPFDHEHCHWCREAGHVALNCHH